MNVQFCIKIFDQHKGLNFLKHGRLGRISGFPATAGRRKHVK
jgi:hypothetical protein